jgi:hypothetical protein
MTPYKKPKRKPRMQVPVSVLADEKLTIYEKLVEYLKERRKLTYREIGRLLRRDERNIWTVYHRAKKKRGG